MALLKVICWALIFIIRMRTNYLKKSFLYDGSSLWNSIPTEIKESESLSSFRTKIAAYIDS